MGHVPARRFSPEEEFQKGIEMLYDVIGCDPETGRPNRGKLIELGLEWVEELLRERQGCDVNLQLLSNHPVGGISSSHSLRFLGQVDLNGPCSRFRQVNPNSGKNHVFPFPQPAPLITRSLALSFQRLD